MLKFYVEIPTARTAKFVASVLLFLISVVHWRGSDTDRQKHFPSTSKLVRNGKRTTTKKKIMKTHVV